MILHEPVEGTHSGLGPVMELFSMPFVRNQLKPLMYLKGSAQNNSICSPNPEWPEKKECPVEVVDIDQSVVVGLEKVRDATAVFRIPPE